MTSKQKMVTLTRLLSESLSTTDKAEKERIRQEIEEVKKVSVEI